MPERLGHPYPYGTRVPARTLAQLIEMGETQQTLRDDYPHISSEAYALAVLWAHANPRRGRPSAAATAAAEPTTQPPKARRTARR